MVQWNILMALFLIAFFSKALVKWVLSYLNVAHLNRHGGCVPEIFAGDVDGKTLGRMRDYTVTGSRFSTTEDLFEDGFLLLFLLTGVFVWFDGWVRSWRFSTTTAGLWFSDQLKSTLISLVLLVVFLSLLFALMRWTPGTWWLWVWLVFSVFQLLLSWIYPVLIAPLFNRFVPVQDEALRGRIFALMQQCGLKAKEIYQVDAGKRSRHTNAYFTGLGRTKRIVLYDTLLSAHDHEEILSILAHEIGHWKKRHVFRQILTLELFALVLLLGIHALVEWPLLYRTFGFAEATPYVGVFLVVILLEPFLYFLTPVLSIRARRYEREADRFAFECIGTGVHLARAMKKLAKDNLANLHPHPLYAWFYYSHPPLTRRIADLQKMGKT